MTIAGLVLGAGAGSRFQGPEHKLLASFRGHPLASWAIRSAHEAGFNQLYVVSGAVDLQAALAQELADIWEAITWVESPSWAEGQSKSLAAGVGRVSDDGHQAVVVGLADQPMVPASAWRSVGAARGPITIADFEGQRRPPVKLERSVWPLLPEEGDFGARELIRAHPGLVSPVPCVGKAADIDTKRDLEEWN